MKNQVYTGTPTSRRFSTCPTTIKSGDPVLIGKRPAVALDDYQSITGGTTFLLGGSFTLTTVGKSVLSPVTNAAIPPGDPVYADTDGSTFTTGGANLYYGFTLDANSSGTLFGHVDPSYTGGVASGATDTAATIMLAGEE